MFTYRHFVRCSARLLDTGKTIPLECAHYLVACDRARVEDLSRPLIYGEIVHYLSTIYNNLLLVFQRLQLLFPGPGSTLPDASVQF